MGGTDKEEDNFESSDLPRVYQKSSPTLLAPVRTHTHTHLMWMTSFFPSPQICTGSLLLVIPSTMCVCVCAHTFSPQKSARVILPTAFQTLVCKTGMDLDLITVLYLT